MPTSLYLGPYSCPSSLDPCQLLTPLVYLYNHPTHLVGILASHPKTELFARAGHVSCKYSLCPRGWAPGFRSAFFLYISKSYPGTYIPRSDAYTSHGLESLTVSSCGCLSVTGALVLASRECIKGEGGSHEWWDVDITSHLPHGAECSQALWSTWSSWLPFYRVLGEMRWDLFGGKPCNQKEGKMTDFVQPPSVSQPTSIGEWTFARAFYYLNVFFTEVMPSKENPLWVIWLFRSALQGLSSLSSKIRQ